MLSPESPELRSGQLLEKYICQLTPETVTATKMSPKIGNTCLTFFKPLIVYMYMLTHLQTLNLVGQEKLFLSRCLHPILITNSVSRDFTDLTGDGSSLFFLFLQTLGHLEKAVVLELTLKHVKALTNLIDQQQQKIIALQSGLQAGECLA